MRRTLYLKFILAYLIFGVFGVIIVSSFVSRTVYGNILSRKAESYYREANLIANTYAADLYQTNRTLEEVKQQIDDLDIFLSAEIWIINPSGRMILSSRLPLNVEEAVVIDGFDPTVTGKSYYTTGTFFEFNGRFFALGIQFEFSLFPRINMPVCIKKKGKIRVRSRGNLVSRGKFFALDYGHGFFARCGNGTLNSLHKDASCGQSATCQNNQQRCCRQVCEFAGEKLLTIKVHDYSSLS